MSAITFAGESLIAQKVGNNEVLNVDQFVIANISGLDHTAAVNRGELMPAAGDIVYQGQVTQQGYVSANSVVYSLILDSSIGDFDFNWIGLYSSDDDTLVAITYLAMQSKIRSDGNTVGNNLTRNFLLTFDGAQSVTGITIDASTWQADWSARLVGIDERQRLSNIDTFGQMCFWEDAYKVSKNGADYQLEIGNAYVAGIKAENKAIIPITVPSFPNDVWLDVSLNGDISGKTVLVDVVISDQAQADYIDVAGQQHYMTKVASISAAEVITDERNAFVHQSSILAAIQDAIPAGIICMWSGTIQTLPDSYALCDGLNGTPDLRGLFVIGAGGAYAPGITDSADQRQTSESGDHTHDVQTNDHVLTLDEIPAHEHEMGYTAGTSRGSPDNPVGAVFGGTATVSSGSVGGGDAHNHGSSTSSEDGAHTHMVSVLPPFYALAYIMKKRYLVA